MAASVNLDTIGIVKKTDDNVIRLVSDNYDEIIMRLDDVSVKEKEKETTKALIKGVVSGFLERKYAVGGFQAYITSDVLLIYYSTETFQMVLDFHLRQHLKHCSEQFCLDFIIVEKFQRQR